MDYKEQLETMSARAPIAYALGAVMWLLVSVLLINALFHDPVGARRAAVLSGLLFIAVSTSLFRFVCRQFGKQIGQGMAQLCASGLISAAQTEEARQAAQEAEKERDSLALLLDSLPEGVIACDQDGAITVINRAARAIHGIAATAPIPEVLGDYFEPSGADGDRAVAQDDAPLYRVLHDVESTNRELVVRPQGEEPAHVLISGRQLVGNDGDRLGAVVALRNITDLKIHENRLLQSQKFDVISAVAGGVAHNFNNILTVIMGACTLLKLKGKSNPELEPFIRQIMDTSERAAQLTHNLLVCGRKRKLRMAPLDLNDIVMRSKEIIGQSIGADIRLVTVACPVPLPVFIDQEQLEQVLSFLAANAADAMPAGGELRIETALVDDRSMVPDLERGSDSRWARIAVIDTGAGMDKATMSRIFEPFFTTKERSPGIGLSLAMAYGIVRQHKGGMAVTSEPGEGSEFLIYLPINTAGPEELAK